ncbi:MAG: ORF6N domain-containing protein [Oligoflexia bacterium]|nr:ORF6N domain-containing protein [Oligoflexia bacterium]
MEKNQIHIEISQKIFFIRGHKVMLDSDLALLYEVKTKNLNKAVRRNIIRFPEDFMFQVTEKEGEFLRFQIGTSKIRATDDERGGRRYRPLVFTEQGVAMLSSVLKSEKAALVNIEIMRTFVRLRQLLLSNKELSERLDELEKKYDSQFKAVF